MGRLREICLGAALACALSLSATPAQASGALAIDEDIFAGVLLLEVAVPLLVIDGIYAAIGRPMPIWLSIVQIVAGGFLAPLSAMRTSGHGHVMAGAVFCMAWFIGHGVYNTETYPAWARQRMRERARQRALGPD